MSEDSLETLVKKYEEQTTTLAKLEKATEVTKTNRSATVKALCEKAGKGPHLINGQPMYIFAKDDYWFFSKPRGKQKGAGSSPEASE